jgi:uncharacterized membrane protein YeaQ/YmgE (transglycosylase-associated protein family)
MDLANLIISLLSGLVGGNVAGGAMQDKGLGTLGNSIAGLVGGGAGGWLMKALGLIAAAAGPAATATGAAPVTGAEGIDFGSIIANIAGSGIGGAILTALAAWIKNSVQKT